MPALLLKSGATFILIMEKSRNQLIKRIEHFTDKITSAVSIDLRARKFYR